MRALIRSTIVTDATLIGLGVVDTGVLSGDVDSFQERPFLNLKWGPRNPGISIVTNTTLVIWVHDQPNDYTRIDTICNRLRWLLGDIEAAPAVGHGGSAAWIDQVIWTGDSPDLSDPGHGTITKQVNFTIIGSEEAQ